jgi:hypothetical protein
MSKNSKMLAAVDKQRKRIFVLATPNVCAIKKDGMWYQSAPVPFEEIDEFYELITDLQIVEALVEEAKAELRIP